MLPEWSLTSDQIEGKIASTRTYRKVYRAAILAGDTPDQAVLNAMAASDAELTQKNPGWKSGRGSIFCLPWNLPIY